MSDSIPCGWQRRSLSSLGEYENGFAFSDRHWSEAGLPIVRIAQITGSQGIVDRYPGRLPDKFRIDSGDLIFSWSGTLAVVRWTGGPAWLNQHLFKVVPYAGIDRSLMFHLLQASVAEMSKRTHGSTMKHIKRGELREFYVTLPIDSDEQRKLAQILDTLDAAIIETKAIIAKLKAVKLGLLHDLLTRGIDSNGELRPPHAESPHIYKESPVGWIPKEWECKTFGDLCESSAFGPRFPSDAYEENGPLATLRTTDMDDEGNISLFTMPRAAIKPSVFADHLLRPGDIVISRSGTCGVTGVFNGHEIPVVPGAFLIRFRLRDVCLNRFYRRYFNSSIGRPYLERLAVGGVQKNIKGSDVLCLQVPAPTPFEAKVIAERIDSVEDDTERNQQLLAKLLLQKSGLMDDLLTGRVRVTPLLAEAAQHTGSV